MSPDSTVDAGVKGVAPEARRNLSRLNTTALLKGAAACVIGAGVPLAGFDPLNHASDVLDVADAPARVAILPAALLTALALAAALVFPRDRPIAVPTVIWAAFTCLIAGGAASVAGSDDPVSSALTFVLAIAIPALLIIAIVSADLPLSLLWGSFLAVTAVLLLRADVVFLQTEGFPTPSTLFDAKFSNEVYDFHYNTLGNPNHTAGFLLMPIALSAFWLIGVGGRTKGGLLLAASAALCTATLVLTYSRSAVLVTVVVLLVAVAYAPVPRIIRSIAFVAIAAGALALIVAASDYAIDLLSSEQGTSTHERLESIEGGLAVIADHPLIGVGLGQHSAAGGYLVAHSSIIQAGAEMGVLGLAGLLLLTGGVTWVAIRLVRTTGMGGLGSAAALAATVYVLYAAGAGPASAGLSSGFISIWGMTLAMLLATAVVIGAPRGAFAPKTGEPFGSRLRRLARTPPRRIVHRLGSEIGQRRMRLPIARAAGGRGRLAVERILPVERSVAMARTTESTASLGAWAEAISAVRADSRLRGRLEQRRDRALAGRHDLFGDHPIELGSPPPWQRDLRTEDEWPHGYYRSIAYAELDRRSDVKYAWELSRLRNCVALAQSVAVLEDDESAGVLERELRDWQDKNPIGHGVNWTCAMEVALRAVNLICVDSILLASGRGTKLRELLVPSLYQHGWFLYRNLEISSVNGNHFLADAVGLIWLGTYFGEIGEAPEWLERGREMVREAADQQVLADGLDHEGSLPYHLLVLELFLVAFAVDRSGLAAIGEPLSAMTDAACRFCDADGRVPNVGDDDGGRVLAFSDAPSRDARRVLRLAGVLLGHAAARAAAGDQHPEDALWLGGDEAAKAPARAAAVEAPEYLAEGGMVILGDRRDHVVMDVGPVGFRGLGGHGHLDAMSFEATLGGELAVRDSGTATYTGDAALRNRLRDAPAHNVVVVDDRRYARLGPTLWSIDGDSPPEVLDRGHDADSQHVVARQELPAKAGSATHERRLTWGPGRLVCRDRVTAPAGAAVTHYLQLPAGARREGDRFHAGPFEYALEAPDTAAIEIDEVEYSEAYGAHGAAARVAVTYEAGDEPSEVVWTIGRR